MSKIKSTVLLEQAKVDTNTIIQIIKEEFQTLGEHQLNWKSAPEKWSVLQCLEHLNLTSRHYIPEMQKAVQKAITQGSSPTEYFKRGFIGNKMTTGTRPKTNGEISNPIKTFKNYNPNNLAPSESTQVVFDEFLQHHQDLLAIIAQSAMVKMNKIKVKSLLGSILKFKLGDAIEFLIAHEQRHILQAQRVLEVQVKP